MTSLPSLFLAHGAPDLPLGDHAAKRFFSGLARQLPLPKAILMISAHWETDALALTTAAAPETLYDFSGWPQPLYSLKYPARTELELIDRAKRALGQAGITIGEDTRRGYDHGIWVPLLLIYPDADIPVVQLSLQRGRSARRHFEIGRALAPLRNEGVLIIGSGAAVHNLGTLTPEGTPAPNWAKDFDLWLDSHIKARDLDPLLEFPALPLEARQSHPTLEHLMPLFVTMGAGWRAGHSARLHHSYSYGSLSMACYAFGTQVEVNLANTQNNGRNHALSS